MIWKCPLLDLKSSNPYITSHFTEKAVTGNATVALQKRSVWSYNIVMKNKRTIK
jgi:hypothetical protein